MPPLSTAQWTPHAIHGEVGLKRLNTNPSELQNISRVVPAVYAMMTAGAVVLGLEITRHLTE